MTNGYRRTIGILIAMLTIELVTLACLAALNSNPIGGSYNRARTINTIMFDRVGE